MIQKKLSAYKLGVVNRSDQYSQKQSTTKTNQSSTRDIEKFGGLGSNQSSTLTTLTAMRKALLPMINVGTLAKVVIVDKLNNKVSVKPFPLLDSENQKNIECTCSLYRDIKKIVINVPTFGGSTEDVSIEWEWKSIINELEVNDIVCVVFMDRNFKQNLKQSRTNNKLSNLSDEQKYHSDSYGVIVAVMNKQTMNI